MQLLEGLGSYSRPVPQLKPEAQAHFDQGLKLLFAFNHDEAIRAFAAAEALDPAHPMPPWGLAIANGPHINNPAVPPEREKAAWEALQRCRERLDRAGPVERALIAAADTRYANPPRADRKALDEAYAAAMRDVWKSYPDDVDVGALFAEAMMDLRPWDLWTHQGQPQPGTEEIVRTLEQVMARRPDHPLALHLYIHAVEASPTPGRAEVAADRLRDLQPGLGHMVHMPSHIDVRLGNWEKADRANALAIEADRRYRQVRPQIGFYGVYIAHNHHMRAYAAMMTGQSEKALRVMDELVAEMPEQWRTDFAPIADGYLVMPLEVRIRFGLWDQILAAPAPDEKRPGQYPLGRTLWHYARGVALAAKGDPVQARAEQQRMVAAKANVPADSFFGNNAAAALVGVAEALLEGEILYREGKVEPALQALKTAVQREDALRYSEPPDWIHPTRHALGAILVRERRFAEAEKVYREDLAKLPRNGWALFGLGQSLRGLKKPEEAKSVDQQLAVTWKHADVELRSSCACQAAR